MNYLSVHTPWSANASRHVSIAWFDHLFLHVNTLQVCRTGHGGAAGENFILCSLLGAIFWKKVFAQLDTSFPFNFRVRVKIYSSKFFNLESNVFVHLHHAQSKQKKVENEKIVKNYQSAWFGLKLWLLEDLVNFDIKRREPS